MRHKVTDELDSEVLTALTGRNDRLYQEEGLGKRIVEEAGSLVVETWGLSWPWLIMHMITYFLVCMPKWYLEGRVFRVEIWYEPIESLAPEIELHFQTRPGETVIQALQRLDREAAGMRARLEATKNPLPSGRIPTDLDRGLRNGVGMYARWFYAHRICQVPTRQIARARHDKLHPHKDFANCGCRSLVQYGIKEAERLLSETPYNPFSQPESPLPK